MRKMEFQFYLVIGNTVLYTYRTANNVQIVLEIIRFSVLQAE